MTNTYTTAKIWFCGEYINVELGQKFFVGHCGGWTSVFGEPATLTKITDKHCIFTTESGAKISTSAENLHIVSGKAGKQGNFVKPYREGMKYYKSALYVW